MGPAFFVLAILGCGEGDGPCQQVAVTSTHYSSQAACTAETEAAVQRYQDADYPVVVAECRAAGVKMAQVHTNELRLPPPEHVSLVRSASYTADRRAGY